MCLYYIEKFSIWLDEDNSYDPKKFSEWLQPSSDYVPKTEEDFHKERELRQVMMIFLYKDSSVKSVVDFIGIINFREEAGHFRFFEQIARNDLQIIYHFAEKYMAMSNKKLEWKEKILNEIERRNYYESAKNVFSSPAAQNLLYFTRKEIDDISQYL